MKESLGNADHRWNRVEVKGDTVQGQKVSLLPTRGLKGNFRTELALLLGACLVPSHVSHTSAPQLSADIGGALHRSLGSLCVWLSFLPQILASWSPARSAWLFFLGGCLAGLGYPPCPRG